LHGDGCVTGGRPGLQTRAWGTNTVPDRFDSYASPPTTAEKIANQQTLPK